MPIEPISELIRFVRGQRVILASDLASLYGVPTKALNLAVKRNAERFPADFMFILTKKETAALRFQFETSKKGRGGRRYPEKAFTEHGVAMLSSVLNSTRAIRLNIEIVRAFIRLRHILLSNRELARRIGHLEKKFLEHDQALGQQEADLTAVFEELRSLIDGPKEGRRRIGFAKDR